ncbi:MAG: spore coat protein CotJB [Lachnospiraceae bacterium]|jgi:spore coat protein JB|nr:spore coat protein CotJB [Lachnospiraceae bacterium]
MNQREQLYREIGIVDFVLVELTEYLDTHPTDIQALDYFNHYAKIKNQMMSEFAQKYYPLSKDLQESNQEWKWGSAPLPWEGA